jgi:hypothetical protein
MSRWNFEGWVYRDQLGKMVGPIQADEFKRAIGRGTVAPTDRVWTSWAGPQRILLPELARRVYDPAPLESPS